MLVNYHKLDKARLETLAYTYLGDWISRQKAAHQNGESAAGDRLSAAQCLQKKLQLILEGETPYDIFVRWKPIEAQPVGWNPDLNDGVRLNIRPFMEAKILMKIRPPRLKKQSECKPLVRQLSQKCDQPLEQEFPPSLQSACTELQRIV